MTGVLTPHGIPLVNGYGPWRDPAAEATQLYDTTVAALGYSPDDIDTRHQPPTQPVEPASLLTPATGVLTVVRHKEASA